MWPVHSLSRYARSLNTAQITQRRIVLPLCLDEKNECKVYIREPNIKRNQELGNVNQKCIFTTAYFVSRVHYNLAPS